MSKNSKLLSIVCTVTVSVLCMIILILGLILSGVISLGDKRLVIKSDSAQEVYDGTPLVAHGFSIVSGELQSGHTVSASYSGIQNYAGESQNIFYVSIFDSNGADVTDEYDLYLEYGELEVLQKPIKIVSGNAQKIYDGKPLTSDEWDYFPKTALMANNRMEVDVVGEITNVGIALNTIGSVSIFNESGKDISHNYKITYEYGILTVVGIGGLDVDDLKDFIGEDGKLDISGGIGAGSPSDDSLEKVCYRVRSNMEDRVYLKIKSYGDYHYTSWADANAYTKRIDRIYSADYLTGEAINSTFAKLDILSQNGQYALPMHMTMTGTKGYSVQLSDVQYTGNTDNLYTVYYSKYNYNAVYSLPAKYAEFEREYRDYVYENYLSVDETTREYMQKLANDNRFSGKDMATILAVAEYIQSSAEYNTDYDRALDTAQNIAIAFLDEYKEGICQHYATAATLLYRTMGIPARYTVGFVADTEAGEYVEVKAKQAHAWVEVYIDGVGWCVIEVTGQVGYGDGSGSGDGSGDGSDSGETHIVSIRPVNVSAKYNGQTLKASNVVTGFEEYEKMGYTYSATVEGEAKTPGKAESSIKEFTVFDPNGNDVTDQFIVKKTNGVIHLYISEIVVRSDSAAKVYDGAPLVTDLESCKAVSGQLYSMKLVFGSDASITDVGSKKADFACSVIEINTGIDVTDMYKITKECGTLTVLSRSITVKANDASKVYDGTPLTCNSISITEGSLASTDKVASYTVLGEQTEIGRRDNIVSEIVINNEQGVDVTRNYSIKYETGKLRVTPNF